MFGVFIVDLLFFGVPLIFISLFIVCLVRFLSVFREYKKNPETVNLKKHLIFLILSAVPVAVILLFVIGIILIMAGAVAFM